MLNRASSPATIPSDSSLNNASSSASRLLFAQIPRSFCRWLFVWESKQLSAPSIKQHLAALRGLFNWLVIRHVVPYNPALFVKGPRFSRQVGITPIMEAEQMRLLLDSIPVVRKVKVARKHGGGYKEVADVKGLRDRAAIAIMAYTFARVSALVGLRLAITGWKESARG